jgi:fructokinase
VNPPATSTQPLYGAIEAGGTKFVCAVGSAPGEWLSETRIATATPAQTLRAVVDFFEAAERVHGTVRALGVGAFGPLELNPDSPQWGRLLKTPKAGWSGADLVAPLRERFGVPVAIDTDVNAAALAEAQLGAGRGLRSVAYITVGTGIGGGFAIDGLSLRGVMHPEIGHIAMRRDPRDLGFKGNCPFHGDCLEGLASGPAIMARWQRSLSEPTMQPEACEIVAGYLGQLAASIALTVSSECIVFGGGVMDTPGLIERVRAAAAQQLNGYLPRAPLDGTLDNYIVAPGLGTRSGLTGALLLAQRAVQQAVQQ